MGRSHTQRAVRGGRIHPPAERREELGCPGPGEGDDAGAAPQGRSGCPTGREWGRPSFASPRTQQPPSFARSPAGFSDSAHPPAPGIPSLFPRGFVLTLVESATRWNRGKAGVPRRSAPARARGSLFTGAERSWAQLRSERSFHLRRLAAGWGGCPRPGPPARAPLPSQAKLGPAVSPKRPHLMIQIIYEPR
jgi:hypothetical protein